MKKVLLLLSFLTLVMISCQKNEPGIFKSKRITRIETTVNEQPYIIERIVYKNDKIEASDFSIDTNVDTGGSVVDGDVNIDPEVSDQIDNIGNSLGDFSSFEDFTGYQLYFKYNKNKLDKITLKTTINDMPFSLSPTLSLSKKGLVENLKISLLGVANMNCDFKYENNKITSMKTNVSISIADVEASGNIKLTYKNGSATDANVYVNDEMMAKVKFNYSNTKNKSRIPNPLLGNNSFALLYSGFAGEAEDYLISSIDYYSSTDEYISSTVYNYEIDDDGYVMSYWYENNDKTIVTTLTYNE